MADITYGSASEFESGVTNWCQCCEIDTDKFVVAYRDAGDGDAGKAIIATVSGTTIAWGAISEFCSDIGVGGQLGVCKLDTDKFVVVYADDANADDGYARVGTVSTRTISWGTAKEFETGDTEYPGCCQLGTDKFAIVYRDEAAGDLSTVCVCTVSGDTITSGTPVAFGGSILDCRCCKLDTDKFVAVYRDAGDNWKVKACVFTVSNTTPTPGTIKVIYDDDIGTAYVDCDQLDTDKFVIIWRVGGGAGDCYAAVCTVATTTITLGTKVTISSNEPMTVGVAVTDSTHFVAIFEDGGDSYKGKSRLCSVSDTTAITMGDAEVWHDAGTRYVSVCLISADKIAIAYRDDADASDIGEAIIGDIAAGVDITVEVTLATADAAGVVPTLSIGSTLLPPAATADAAGVVPEVRMSLTIQVPVGTIDAEALAAILSIGSTLLPPVATVDAAGLAPTLSIGITMLPPVATITADGKAPTLSLGVTIVVPLATITVAGLIPNIITEWIKLTLGVRSLAMTLKPRSIKLTLKPRSLAMTLPKKRK